MIISQTAEDKQRWGGEENLLQFEQLLSEISATYINLPSDRVRQVIRRDLGRVGRFLDADFCSFFFLDKEPQSFKLEVPFAWWAEKYNERAEEANQWMERKPDFFNGFQYNIERWSRGEVTRFNSLEELPREAGRLKSLFRRLGVKSMLSVPISASGQVFGAALISAMHSHRMWPDELIPRMRLAGEVFVNSLVRKRWEDSLQSALAEIKELKAKIEADYHFLGEEVDLGVHVCGTIGNSGAFQDTLRQVKQVAPTNATVLVLGETGTGKGFIARVLHNASRRSDRPFMQVNCAALSPSLIESEFFGHEKGAFTGAQSRRIGWFEKAKGTTLFLDEVGDLSLEIQAKLLRILQDGEFERGGGTDTLRTDARVIAATNHNLEKEVEAGRFRRDLWYRLNAFPIHLPPLRARQDDIPLFVEVFLERYSKTIGKRFDPIPKKTIRMLQGYSWPGNIRELENLIERAVITSPPGHLSIQVPTFSGRQKAESRKTLDDHEASTSWRRWRKHAGGSRARLGRRHGWVSTPAP